jgi:imidazolonepropionase-like amidohydrolase
MWLAACAVACAHPVPEELVLTGLRSPGGAPVELHLRDGRLVAVGSTVPHPVGVEVREQGGRYVAPAFVDSHVHLAYLPAGPELRDGGVAAVVDLAAPLDRRPEVDGLVVRWSGPMITAVRGYPTTSWGRDGYGTEVRGAGEARAAVRRHVAAGATVVKVPIGSGGLTDAEVEAVVAEAHAAGVPVVAHALSDADAARSAALGVDGLAHTPVEPLADATVAAWAGRFVISTLGAFGGDAIGNLRRLRAAGATVLYGTDFGNTRTPGIDPAELSLLVAAGLDGAAILDAATTAPARQWGLDGLGALTSGARASLLVLDADPHVDPTTLGRPVEVWIDGVPRAARQ